MKRHITHTLLTVINFGHNRKTIKTTLFVAFADFFIIQHVSLGGALPSGRGFTQWEGLYPVGGALVSELIPSVPVYMFVCLLF